MKPSWRKLDPFTLSVARRAIENARMEAESTELRHRAARDLPSLLTVYQVAGVLQKSQKAVRRMIDRNQLPVSRIGRCVRIRRDPLLKRLKV